MARETRGLLANDAWIADGNYTERSISDSNAPTPSCPGDAVVAVRGTSVAARLPNAGHAA